MTGCLLLFHSPWAFKTLLLNCGHLDATCCWYRCCNVLLRIFTTGWSHISVLTGGRRDDDIPWSIWISSCCGSGGTRELVFRQSVCRIVPYQRHDRRRSV